VTVAPTIVFDLDGTLIDSRDAMVAAFAAAFRRTVGEGPAPVGEFLALRASASMRSSRHSAYPSRCGSRSSRSPGCALSRCR
jgi:phosphoglycolate phosphatase-like HAD superfamily hydrolase